MRVGALHPYEQSLISREPLALAHGDSVTPLDVARWLAPADPVDLAVVRRLDGPVLDVGCGPGRITEALVESGFLALGIDISVAAVAMTRARGLNALCRNVFDHVPGEGRWGTTLLLDGNIGIGGDPTTLLRRQRCLLRPGGGVVVELDPRPDLDVRVMARFFRDGLPVGPEFPWALVGRDAVARHAAQAELTVSARWRDDGREFAVLRADSVTCS